MWNSGSQNQEDKGDGGRAYKNEDSMNSDGNGSDDGESYFNNNDDAYVNGETNQYIYQNYWYY